MNNEYYVQRDGYKEYIIPDGSCYAPVDMINNAISLIGVFKSVLTSIEDEQIRNQCSEAIDRFIGDYRPFLDLHINDKCKHTNH